MDYGSHSQSATSNRYSEHSKHKHPKYPLIWTATHINTKNLSNVYLYVSRKNGKGTRPHSVSPTQYLLKLQQNNISITSLNIPSECPVVDKQQLQRVYQLNDIQCQQAQETTKILWNIVHSEINKSTCTSHQSCNTNTVYDNSHNTNNNNRYVTLTDLNQMNNSLMNKLNLIFNKCGDGSNSIELLRLEKKNQDLEFKLIEKTDELNVAQETIQTQATMMIDMKRKIKNGKNMTRYYKKVATKQRETLKVVGLYHKGDLIVRCGYRQLMKRIGFLQAYMKQMYDIDTEFVNQLIMKYVVTNEQITNYLYTNVFKDKFYSEYESEIRRFELDIDSAIRCMVAYHHKYLSRSAYNEMRQANVFEKATYSVIYGV
eukprot:212846_1